MTELLTMLGLLLTLMTGMVGKLFCAICLGGLGVGLWFRKVPFSYFLVFLIGCAILFGARELMDYFQP